MDIISSYTIPLILAGMGAFFLFSKNDVFEAFLQGAGEGLATSVKLIPTLVLLLVGISMFRAGGALDILTRALAPAFSVIGIPEEIIPFIIMRPISGSGSTAMLSDLFSRYGADSYAGRAASLIMGSSDTAFYIFAVYFGAVKIKKTGYALSAALLAQLFCAAAACLIARLFWGA